jgi:hypothetical protein
MAATATISSTATKSRLPIGSTTLGFTDDGTRLIVQGPDYYHQPEQQHGRISSVSLATLAPQRACSSRSGVPGRGDQFREHVWRAAARWSSPRSCWSGLRAPEDPNEEDGSRPRRWRRSRASSSGSGWMRHPRGPRAPRGAARLDRTAATRSGSIMRERGCACLATARRWTSSYVIAGRARPGACVYAGIGPAAALVRQRDCSRVSRRGSLVGCRCVIEIPFLSSSPVVCS